MSLNNNNDTNLEKGYMGNTLLKPSNQKVSFTEEQVKEYIKCADDPVYFIRNYVKIVNVDKGLVPFRLYDYQEQLVNLLHDNRFIVCRFGRQLGKSTTSAAYMLHYILFNSEKVAAILANKLNTAREILDRVKKMFEYLPKWLQQGVEEWHKTSITLENGSKIIAAATSSSAIRGFSVNVILLDEYAFIHPNQAEEFYTSVFPTISSGKDTKVIVVSTPNGLNHFYKLWVEAEEGRSDYVPFLITWDKHPERDQEWAEQQIRQTSRRQFDQEHQCEFLGSSNTLISGPKLRSLVYKPPIHETEDGLWVFEKSEGNHNYVMVADVSHGNKMDYHAFIVVDITSAPYKVVAAFRNNEMPPLVYPDILHSTATTYNNASLLVEVNDIGNQVSQILYEDLEYENLVQVTQRGRKGQVADSGFGSKKSQLGLRTSKATKRIGCSILKTLIEEDKLLFDDSRILHEMSVFISRKQSYEADIGQNDDLMMCMVNFAWLTSQPLFSDLAAFDPRKELYSKDLEKMKNEMMPFGFMFDGTNDDEESSFVDAQGQRWDIAETYSYDEDDRDDLRLF